MASSKEDHKRKNEFRERDPVEDGQSTSPRGARVWTCN